MIRGIYFLSCLFSTFNICYNFWTAISFIKLPDFDFSCISGQSDERHRCQVPDRYEFVVGWGCRRVWHKFYWQIAKQFWILYMQCLSECTCTSSVKIHEVISPDKSMAISVFPLVLTSLFLSFSPIETVIYSVWVIVKHPSQCRKDLHSSFLSKYTCIYSVWFFDIELLTCYKFKIWFLVHLQLSVSVFASVSAFMCKMLGQMLNSGISIFLYFFLHLNFAYPTNKALYIIYIKSLQQTCIWWFLQLWLFIWLKILMRYSCKNDYFCLPWIGLCLLAMSRHNMYTKVKWKSIMVHIYFGSTCNLKLLLLELFWEE